MNTIDQSPGRAPASVARRNGIFTMVAAVVGLALGPSVFAVLAFGVFIRPIEAEFGWSRVEVSLASTLIAYMIMLVSPLQGILVDRFGPRRVILCSIPAFSGGLALFYFLPSNLLLFYVFWGLIPVLALGLWPLAYLQAVSHWFDRRLGLALGIANGGIGLGTAVVPVIASALIASLGWREALVALGVLVLLVSWPVIFFCLREVRDRGTDANNTPPLIPLFGIPYRAAARTAEFRRLVLAFLLLGLSLTGLVTQQIPMLIDAGWSPQRAALVQATFGIALLVARVGVGYVIDQFFAPLVMAVIALCGAVACLLYAVYPAAAFVSSALLGLVVGAEFDVLAFLIKRYFGTEAFGRIYGTMFAVFQFTSGLSVAAFAFSRQTFGSYTPGLYGLVVILVVAAYLLVRLGPYRYAPGATVARQGTSG